MRRGGEGGEELVKGDDGLRLVAGELVMPAQREKVGEVKPFVGKVGFGEVEVVIEGFCGVGLKTVCFDGLVRVWSKGGE